MSNPIYRNEFDQLLPEAVTHNSQDEPPPTLELLPALEVYRVTCRLFLIFKQQRDRKRFEKLCKYIVQSLHSESVKLSYVGVFLNKEYRYDIAFTLKLQAVMKVYFKFGHVIDKSFLHYGDTVIVKLY